MPRKLITTETATGRVIQKGETVTDFRGNRAVFAGATRAASDGKSGKVSVKYGSSSTEYYDRVFGLAVTAE